MPAGSCSPLLRPASKETSIVSIVGLMQRLWQAPVDERDNIIRRGTRQTVGRDRETSVLGFGATRHNGRHSRRRAYEGDTGRQPGSETCPTTKPDNAPDEMDVRRVLCEGNLRSDLSESETSYTQRACR